MNSELYDNLYQIPERIVNRIKAALYNNPTGDGIKRAKNLINNSNVTYQQLKRLKNFFAEYNSETTPLSQYELSGGDEMRDFVDQTLQRERSRTASSEKNMRNINAGSNVRTIYAQDGSVNLKENGGVNGGVELSKNAVVIIFDEEMRILVLKRSSYPNQWEANSYSLPGGSIEDGEAPIEGAKREVKEETGIEIQNILEKFVIQREDNVEHIFVTKLSENQKNCDVVLDKENAGYFWASTKELLKMNQDQFVPNFFDYIRICVTNYE